MWVYSLVQVRLYIGICAGVEVGSSYPGKKVLSCLPLLCVIFGYVVRFCCVLHLGLLLGLGLDIDQIWCEDLNIGGVYL